MLRAVLFFVGFALALFGIFAPHFVGTDASVNRFRLYEVGMFMMLAAHGWPEGVLR